MGEYYNLSTGNLKPVKSLGQNFLNSVQIVHDIADASGVNDTNLVIEIGPGHGIMTDILAKRAGFVVAVEIDRRLEPELNILKITHQNLEIIYDDILKVDINEIVANYLKPRGLSSVKIIANLPYYITTPIIMMLLEKNISDLDSITVMVQKEVGERMTANPGGKDYGAMTVTVGYFSEATICFNVPAHYFVPRPKVDSCIVHMKIHNAPPFELADKDYFFKVVKASFAQRRKMLVNSLMNAGYLHVSRQICLDALSNMGKDFKIRGETLSPSEFGILSNLLYEKMLLE